MSERMLWIGLGLFCLASSACGGAAAASNSTAAAAPPAVRADKRADKRADDAERALESARAKKMRLEGSRGSRRESLRRRAVKAYRDVARRYPDSGQVAAEASFRAGELLRAGGDDNAALKQFFRAADTARGGVFVPRARYEAAQIRRRTRRFDAALELFAEVEGDRFADQHRRDLAALWRAKTRLEMGDEDEAERQLRSLVRRASDPIDRLRAYDELILILARSGRLAAAVGHFAEAKRSVLRESLERTTRGERVRKTLEDMRALDVLREAIAAAR